MTPEFKGVYTLNMEPQPSNKRSPDASDVAGCTYANLRKASRAVGQVYDAALHRSGLKATQFSLLATLNAHGDMPLSQLADVLVMDRTTLTRNLKPLVAKDLVHIAPDDDRRVRRVSLSRHGQRVLENARPLWATAQNHLVEGLGHRRWSELLANLSDTVALLRGR